MAKQADKSKEETQDPTEKIETLEECFIITPIGKPGSDTFKKAMGLIDAIIRPVLLDYNMIPTPANEMPDLGSINKQLIRRVIEDRIVIANLTGLNANVMYELAVRHAARKPVIIMAENDTVMPFDITDQRTIFYDNSLAGVKDAQEALRKHIDFAEKDSKPDNPIYSYLENAKLFQEISETNPDKALLALLNSINDKVSSSYDHRLPHAFPPTVSYKKNKYENYRISGRFADLDDTSEEYTNLIKQVFSLVSGIYPLNGGIAHMDNGKFRFTLLNPSASIVNEVTNQMVTAFPELRDLKIEIIETR